MKSNNEFVNREMMNPFSRFSFRYLKELLKHKERENKMDKYGNRREQKAQKNTVINGRFPAKDENTLGSSEGVLEQSTGSHLTAAPIYQEISCLREQLNSVEVVLDDLISRIHPVMLDVKTLSPEVPSAKPLSNPISPLEQDIQDLIRVARLIKDRIIEVNTLVRL